MKTRCSETGPTESKDHAIDTNFDTVLGVYTDGERQIFPNMKEEKASRFQRSFEIMKAHPLITSALSPHSSTKDALSLEEEAALTIQKNFRGYLGRKEYLERLYEQIAEDEEEMRLKEQQHVNEGSLLVESYQLERELEDADTIVSNHARQRQSQAITIQRAWRRHRDTGDDASAGIDGGSSASRSDDDATTIDDAVMMNRHRCHDNYEEDQSWFDPYAPYQESGGWDDGNYYADEEYTMGHDNTTDCIDFDALRLDDARRLSPHTSFADDDADCLRATTPQSTASFSLPTTDWNSIEAVLRTESGFGSPDHDGRNDSAASYEELDSKWRSAPPPHLQMVFVDDDSLASDAESEPDVKVYVYDDESNESLCSASTLALNSRAATDLDSSGPGYYAMSDKQQHQARQVDSRDSGCVPGDLIDLGIEHVTDAVRPGLVEPAVESTKVLDTLLLHEEYERKTEAESSHRKRKSLVQDNVVTWSNRELQLLREELERKLREASDMLVEELRSRDILHAKQDALLVDVEDWKKMSQDAAATPGCRTHPCSSTNGKER